MTSVLSEDDKIFTIYKQYQELIVKNADGVIYGVDQLAARLTIAHMLDHVVCVIKEDKPPTAKQINYGPTIRTE